MKKSKYLILVFLLFVFAACEDDSADVVLDNTPPTISLTLPAAGSEFFPTDVIPVQARVEDETELEQVTINVTGPNNLNNNFVRVDGEGGVDFTNDRVDDVNITIPLPATAAAGEYTITVSAVDAQGNAATPRSITVTVLEEDAVNPEITVTSPEANTEFALGDEMEIMAQIEEDRNLNEVIVELSSGVNEPIFLHTVTEDLDSETSHTINETFTIPADASVGDYSLTVQATDHRGNVEVVNIPLSIVQSTD